MKATPTPWRRKKQTALAVVLLGVVACTSPVNPAAEALKAPSTGEAAERAKGNTGCPEGLHFEPAQGCVANATPAVVTPSPSPPAAPPASPPESGGMAHIPGGTFQMGDGGPGSTAAHAVTVAAFDMDVTEVTVAAYAACVKKGDCPEGGTTQFYNGQEQGPGACNGNRADRQNHPVNCVDWGQAATYCHAVGKRLPTDEEWEYAARGGSEGRTYSWGNAAPEVQLCWSGVTKRTGTCAVASSPRGAFGLADMAGNVWEWTQSNYDATTRVSRGGSWGRDGASNVRGARRRRNAPSYRIDNLGFRCAR